MTGDIFGSYDEGWDDEIIDLTRQFKEHHDGIDRAQLMLIRKGGHVARVVRRPDDIHEVLVRDGWHMALDDGPPESPHSVSCPHE